MNPQRPIVFFGEPEEDRRPLLRDRLEQDQVETASLATSRQLLELVQREAPDVIVLDQRLESVGDQVLVGLLRMRCPAARIIQLLPPGSHPDRDRERHLDPVCSLVRPVSDDDLHSVIKAALRVTQQERQARRAPVILCVDDDVLFLNGLTRILGRKGYAVIGYDNPEKALEAIPLHHPSLAFIDVLMPGMSGLDLASEIQEEYGDRLPLVLLSARSTDEEIAEGYKTGARYYLTKPCDPGQVLKVTELILGNLGAADPRPLERQF